MTWLGDVGSGIMGIATPARIGMSHLFRSFQGLPCIGHHLGVDLWMRSLLIGAPEDARYLELDQIDA